MTYEYTFQWTPDINVHDAVKRLKAWCYTYAAENPKTGPWSFIFHTEDGAIRMDVTAEDITAVADNHVLIPDLIKCVETMSGMKIRKGYTPQVEGLP